MIDKKHILFLFFSAMHYRYYYPIYSNPFASMIFGPREKSCYSKIMLWKSATKNFYSVIISHYTRENFYSVIISHYTREKCNHKNFSVISVFWCTYILTRYLYNAYDSKLNWQITNYFHSAIMRHVYMWQIITKHSYYCYYFLPIN